MNTQKIVKIALAGVALAGIVCIIAGLCVYVPALNVNPLRSDPDYAQIIESKAEALQLGMLIIVVGCVSLVISFMALLATVIFKRLEKYQNKKDN